MVRVRECRDESTAHVGSSTKCLAVKSFRSQRTGVLRAILSFETYQTFFNLTDVRTVSRGCTSKSSRGDIMNLKAQACDDGRFNPWIFSYHANREDKKYGLPCGGGSNVVWL